MYSLSNFDLAHNKIKRTKINIYQNTYKKYHVDHITLQGSHMLDETEVIANFHNQCS